MYAEEIDRGEGHAEGRWQKRLSFGNEVSSATCDGSTAVD
jgi:hypothetical protein